MRTNRIFIGFVAILLGSTMTCFGQETTGKKLISKFELTGGPSILNNSGYQPDFKPMLGYSLGAGVYHSISKSFDINLRAMWESKGSNIDLSYSLGLPGVNNNVEIKESYKTNFKYLTISMLPTYSFGERKNLVISVGGYYSILKKVNTTSTAVDTKTNTVYSQNESSSKDQFNKNYDFGTSISVGYSFKVGEKNRLLIQAINNHGLVDIQNGWIGSQRNNAFVLMTSFIFGR